MSPYIQNALFTDFYELTMAQGYWKNRMDHPAVFDMFFRKQPFSGGFSVLAGIEPLLQAVNSFHFEKDDIDYLASLNMFEKGFLDYLSGFKFKGDIWTQDEGSVIFPNEPLIRIHSDLIGAQILEGMLLNTVNFQSLIATKTARIWLASKKGSIMEFGLRRAQGADGAMSATRAAFIGGASSTSNSLAGKIYGIPVSGTMAHSWVMSFPSEVEAFETYAEYYPDKSVFLIDTYGALESGIKSAIEVGRKLVAKGKNFGVRLDSGDIQYLSTQVRKELDKAGFPQATITVSNELTEEIIETLVQQGAPINAWGVGTHMVTGGNEASFTGVYKLAAKSSPDGKGMIPTMKFSDNPEKTTNPGIKQVWRLYDENGMAIADILALDGEEIKDGKTCRFYHPSTDYRSFTCCPAKVEPLLKKRMNKGVLTKEPESLGEIKERLSKQLDTFDGTYKRLLNPHIYKVSMTKDLKDLKLSFLNKK